MKEETRELIKENLVKVNETVQKVRTSIDGKWMKEKLLKLYFKSPPKIQSALAKYVVNSVLNKNKSESSELIRH